MTSVLWRAGYPVFGLDEENQKTVVGVIDELDISRHGGIVYFDPRVSLGQRAEHLAANE
jgi:hypothetical protein